MKRQRHTRLTPVNWPNFQPMSWIQPQSANLVRPSISFISLLFFSGPLVGLDRKNLGLYDVLACKEAHVIKEAHVAFSEL
jgi:hypothetical protein